MFCARWYRCTTTSVATPSPTPASTRPKTSTSASPTTVLTARLPAARVAAAAAARSIGTACAPCAELAMRPMPSVTVAVMSDTILLPADITVRTYTHDTPIDAAIAINSSTRKAAKRGALRRPIALPTHGQKWSNVSTQRSVTASCLARSGRTMWHDTHSWLHWPAQSAGESSGWARRGASSRARPGASAPLGSPGPPLPLVRLRPPGAATAPPACGCELAPRGRNPGLASAVHHSTPTPAPPHTSTNAPQGAAPGIGKPGGPGTILHIMNAIIPTMYAVRNGAAWNLTSQWQPRPLLRQLVRVLFHQWCRCVAERHCRSLRACATGVRPLASALYRLGTAPPYSSSSAGPRCPRMAA
mmetsp:Transcript_11768/g.34787  ORF Transcript_11768/g.34787 Transcript_11768/m.34787 type:complete len:358 (+) Transcript_11768:826-1899(+)